MAEKVGGAYIEIRASDKHLDSDLNKAHKKVTKSVDSMESHVTKAFKRMSIVAAAAFAVIAYKTISLVKESAILAARFETLDIVMKQVGGNAGYTAEQMDNFDLALRKTGISMIESRNSLTKMAQAQLDLNQATKLGRIAQDAAVIGNINSSEAFGRMIDGIQSGRVMILKTIGINVNFAQSYKDVAAATNRTVASFNEAEKVIIRQNAVLEYGKRIAGTYEAAMSTAGKKLQSFTRYVEDFKVKMGVAFGPSMVILIDAATAAMKQMQIEIVKPEVQKALESISIHLSKIVADLGADLPGKINRIKTSISGLVDIYNSLPDGVIGAAGYGVIGRILTGSTPIGLFVSGMVLLNTQLKKLYNENELAAAKLLQSGASTAEIMGALEQGENLFSIGVDTTGYDKYLAGQKKKKPIGKIDTQAPTPVPVIDNKAIEQMRQARLRAFNEDQKLLSEKFHQEIEFMNAKIEKEKEAEEKRLEIVKGFNDQYNEIGKTRFDLEREQVERMTEIYREAGVEENRIAKLASDKNIEIARAEQMAKLDIYRNIAGGIANTFQMIAQAGGEQSKEAFLAYKAFAMVEAAISGHQAILKAMAAYPPPYSFIMAGVAAAGAAIQVGMIASSQPPSYDQGGISNAKGIYQTGNIQEAHIPIPSGKIPVEIKEKKQEERPTEITIMNLFDPEMIYEAMASSRGQDSIVNTVGNRSEQIRRVLR